MERPVGQPGLGTWLGKGLGGPAAFEPDNIPRPLPKEAGCGKVALHWLVITSRRSGFLRAGSGSSLVSCHAGKW